MHPLRVLPDGDVVRVRRPYPRGERRRPGDVPPRDQNLRLPRGVLVELLLHEDDLHLFANVHSLRGRLE